MKNKTKHKNNLCPPILLSSLAPTVAWFKQGCFSQRSPREEALRALFCFPLLLIDFNTKMILPIFPHKEMGGRIAVLPLPK